MNAFPPSLTRFESQLEAAIRRERRKRPLILVRRIALATVAASALALGVLSVLPGTGQSAVAHAAAALGAPGDSILHVVLVSTTTNANGSSSSLQIESWERTGPPYAGRELQIRDGHQFEVATLDGESQLYDPQSNTIFVQPLAPGKADLVGKAQVAMGAAEGDRYRMKIKALLESGAAHEDGHVSVGGRDAIRIVSTSPEMTLLVDATTCEPIEWSVTENGSSITAHFPTFEQLPPSDANTALLSLTAQHPAATVDRDPADYQSALARLTGKSGSAGKAVGKS